MDARWCAGCWTILSNGTVIAMNHRIGRCCATSRAAREEPSVPFVGRKSCTGSGIMLQSLLLRLPPLQERVANAVTFPTCQRADHNSDPVGNGDGGPESGATAPIFGAHGANRLAACLRLVLSACGRVACACSGPALSSCPARPPEGLSFAVRGLDRVGALPPQNIG